MLKFLVFLAATGLFFGETSANQPIELRPGEIVSIKKILVSDSKAVLGFLGTPVDGTLKSRNFRGGVVEYPEKYHYGLLWYSDTDSYLCNDGLHITLSDDRGVDAIIARGGASARLYTDVNSIYEPKRQRPVWTFEGKDDVENAVFRRRLRTGSFSFFGVNDTRNPLLLVRGAGQGTLSDIGFFRVDRLRDLPAGELFYLGSGTARLDNPAHEFDVSSIKFALEDKFPINERYVSPLTNNRNSYTVNLREFQTRHFLSPPLHSETGLEAITLDMQISANAPRFTCRLVFHDPIEPALDLFWTELSLRGSGRYRLVMDIPDQVMFEGNRLWITMSFDTDVELSGPAGGSPEIGAVFVPREKALPEALAWRKFLLKSYFKIYGESRPWGSLRRDMTDVEFFRSGHWAGLTPPLFHTIDACHRLAPENDIVRQYREWTYLRRLTELSEIDRPPLPPQGVPEWAWYSRLGLKEINRIAGWWVNERLHPDTGEFGSDVGDDTDMYQQWANLPFFSRDVLGGALLDGGLKLSELALSENLIEGVNRYDSDVLHAYEEGINHLALMQRWFYGDPVHFERCMESARSIEKLTILHPEGGRFFRDFSTMGYDKVVSRPAQPVARGSSWNSLMWHTTFAVADYNKNPTALQYLKEWADAWILAGKPDEWPSNMNPVNGTVLSTSSVPLPGSLGMTFVWLASITGDFSYIEPFMYYYRQGTAPGNAAAFLAECYSMGALDQFDDEILDQLAGRNRMFKVYRTGDYSNLVSDIIGRPVSSSAVISDLYSAMRWPHMYTEAHQFADRIFPDLIRPVSETYVGGAVLRNRFNPSQAVGWDGFGEDYGVLIADHRPDRLKVLIYNFDENPRDGKMSVWALEHGLYSIRIGLADGSGSAIGKLQRNFTRTLKKADEIELSIAPGVVTVIEIEQLEKLDPIHIRADLALSPLDTKIEGNTIRGFVHNIGAAAAETVILDLYDNRGNLVERKSLGSLDAPNDLHPRKHQFLFRPTRKIGRNWKLVVDPDGLIPEIYEGNNTLILE